MFQKFSILVSLGIFLFLPVLPLQAETNEPFTFIAIGDTPYSETEEKRLYATVIGAVQKAAPPFLAVYGDIKSGAETCSEELLLKRKDLFYSMAPGRVFYTPGDNEWTDCDRQSLNPAVSELGQLSLIRKHFFREIPVKNPESWSYARQDNFPENARWLTNNILFVTIHTVSTNNGRMDILKDDIDLALSMVEARDQANRVWLEQAFDFGKQQKVRALVIITQADPTAADGSGECTAYRRMHCDAFADLRDDVIRLSKGFFPSYKDTRLRPVLFLHGDTGPFCFDKTFGGDAAPNLWRLNAWGDFTVPADATVVTVQPENREAPFTAITLLERKVPGQNCRPEF
ncbi:MAG: hypothetical protein MI802_20070 [Desulfobacterales bacterium]|nr:hypothetical protein [Desulfobacterales bacterium]